MDSLAQAGSVGVCLGGVEAGWVRLQPRGTPDGARCQGGGQGVFPESGDAVAQCLDEESGWLLQHPEVGVSYVGELGNAQREQGSVLHGLGDDEPVRLDGPVVRPREPQAVQLVWPDVAAP